MVFVDPGQVDHLDLASATRALYRTVLAAHPDGAHTSGPRSEQA